MTSSNPMCSALANCNKIAFDHDTKLTTSSAAGKGIEGVYTILDASSAGGKWWEEKERGKCLPVIATLHVKCQSRTKGDFKATLRSPNGDVVAVFKRNRARCLLRKDADTEIPVVTPDDKAVFATLRPSMTAGKSTEIDMMSGEGSNPRVSFKLWTPAWQAQSKWCLFSFLCFLPTFGLGGCFGFYKMATAVTVQQLEKYENDRKVERFKDVTHNAVDFDGAVDWREKLAILVLYAFVETDSFVEPPPNTQAASGL